MRKAKRKAGQAAAQPAPPAVPIIIVERDGIDWDNPIPGQAWWTKEAGAPEGTMRLTFVCPGGCGDIGGCRCAEGQFQVLPGAKNQCRGRRP